MRRRHYIPIITGVLIFVAHMLWVCNIPVDECSEVGQSLSLVRQIKNYFSTKHYFLGYSYALAGAFTIFSLLALARNKRTGIAGVLGGTSLVGILYALGCFLIGCCGSPLLTVYISLFGVKALGFREPLVALITTVSVGFGIFWISRKRCCPVCQNDK